MFASQLLFGVGVLSSVATVAAQAPLYGVDVVSSVATVPAQAPTITITILTTITSGSVSLTAATSSDTTVTITVDAGTSTLTALAPPPNDCTPPAHWFGNADGSGLCDNIPDVPTIPNDHDAIVDYLDATTAVIPHPGTIQRCYGDTNKVHVCISDPVHDVPNGHVPDGHVVDHGQKISYTDDDDWKTYADTIKWDDDAPNHPHSMAKRVWMDEDNDGVGDWNEPGVRCRKRYKSHLKQRCCLASIFSSGRDTTENPTEDPSTVARCMAEKSTPMDKGKMMSADELMFFKYAGEYMSYPWGGWNNTKRDSVDGVEGESATPAPGVQQSIQAGAATPDALAYGAVGLVFVLCVVWAVAMAVRRRRSSARITEDAPMGDPANETTGEPDVEKADGQYLYYGTA